MSPKTQIFLLRLFLLVLAVSVQFATTKTYSISKEESYMHVPVNDEQKDNIKEVCDYLSSYLNDSEDEIARCKENFGWHMDRDRSGLRIRCRSTNTVTLEVPTLSHYQIVLLVPHPNDQDPYSVSYNLVQPNSNYAVLMITPGTSHYSIYSTVLDKRGTPLVWHREGSVPHWKAPEKRPYDLQVNITGASSSITGIFTWNRTGEYDACFELITKCKKSRIEIIKIWPESPLSLKMRNLPPNNECSATLVGMHGTTELRFQTRVASPPRNSDDLGPEVIKVPQEFEPVEDVYLYSEEDGDRWKVHVWWPKPAVTPEKYNVTLRANDIISVVLPGNATEVDFEDVSGRDSALYNVSVYSFLGNMMAHNAGRAVFTRMGRAGVSGRVWWWAGAAGGAWCVAALAAALFWRTRLCAHRILSTHKEKASIESKLLESSQEEPPRVETTNGDAWEIQPEQLLLHEVIGEGAFGVVRRGTLGPLGKEVAVKMLKEFPSLEEMRAFRVEMELMKSVGAHPHVVSLVGCCTTRQPAIVAEYCSRGDLLNFLRCSWDVMISKRNANYYNNNFNESEYRNDLFKTPPENSRLVVNKMYDLQGVCDTELTPKDLLSFCRQIAKGMQFLALNKVVHRDLAARNVLVTGDRTLKIADFGLSRDVYEENQYKQKGNEKMPVKWMALESLTRRIYTTQSDVWSFGVVMWEVVTVGGAPYAGVPAARLPRLLRAGYRMPRPQNCTHHLYEIMRACWAERPRDRPTFAELHERLDELLDSASADDYLSLELDDEPPPSTIAHKYFKMILSAKRHWSRGTSYERPLKAPRNHYSSPPETNKYPFG